MRYGICLANLGTFSDPRVPVELGLAAEEHGWDGVFIWDHLAFVWGSPAADPWTVLAAIAASTTRVRLGTAVTPVARRRPQVVAHQVATLDNLSGGRVTFGAGLGGSTCCAGSGPEKRSPTAASTTPSTASPLLRHRHRSGCRSGSGETDPPRC